MEKLFTKTKKETNLKKRAPTGTDASPNKFKKKRKYGSGKRWKPEQRLKASQFRMLNEFLYTHDSSAAVEYFKNRKEDFTIVS